MPISSRTYTAQSASSRDDWPCRFTISAKSTVLRSVRADGRRIGVVAPEDAIGSIEVVCDRRPKDIEMILVAYVMKYRAAAQAAERIASALTAEGKVAEVQQVNAAGN